MNGGDVIVKFKGDTAEYDSALKQVEKSTSSTGSIIKGTVLGLGITKAVQKSMQVIGNSIDGAVSRVDTLNNFPKVMSNLGISAEDSEKSIKKLSKKLTGLPTTLDAGAMAVQRFTSKNQDVAKSTDLFLALNNAILAGGASSQTQANAIEQMSQAYAKGKPDMYEWRSIMTAMPAQLKQVATAMGYIDADALGTALREGDESMDAFMDTIMRLNTEGVGEFLSFEQQAKNSTSGIGTAVTNLKTSVVRGVGNMIQGINDGLAQANLPSISEMIVSLGKKISNVLNKIGSELPKIIKKLKELKPVIISITVALGSMYATLKTLKLIGKISNSISAFKLGIATLQITALKCGTSISTLKAGLALLNLQFLASPIFWVISGIVALVTGFTLLWKKCEGFRNFWIKLWAGTKKVFITMWNSIGNFFTSIIPGWLNSASNFFTNTWEGIKTFFTTTIPATISAFIQNIIEWFKQLPYNIGYLIGTIIGHFINLKNKINEFLTIDIPNFINGIIDWFKQLPDKIWTWLQNAVQKVKDMFTNMIMVVKTEVPKIINGIVGFFKQLPGKVWTWLVNTVQKVRDMFTNMITAVKTELPKFINSFVTKMKELPGKMLDIGKNIVKGLWNGIVGAKDWIVKKVGEFAKGILDGMKKALGIASPSKLMAKEVGQWVPKGIAVGINANTDSVSNAMENINSDILGSFDLSPTLMGTASNHFSPDFNVVVNNNIQQDPLGQMVSNIKTFGGGSKNDFNYGSGL